MTTPRSHTASARYELQGDSQLLRALTNDPLEFLHLHHRLQHGLCRRLEALSGDLLQPGFEYDARAILAYGRLELPMHQLDEEDDLADLVIAGGGGGEAGAMFARLADFHARDSEAWARVRPGLAELALGRVPENPTRLEIDLLMFAESLRQHLTWEDEVVLTESSRRLDAARRAELSIRMADRRGLVSGRGARFDGERTPSSFGAHGYH